MKTILLNDQQHSELRSIFQQVKPCPYTDYIAFREEVRRLVSNGLPDYFTNFCAEILKEKENNDTVFLMRNCPVDENVPTFDTSDPLRSKYELKKTFIGETFLELMSVMIDSPPLAYGTRNNGDFFHDVYAQDKYSATQTQKTDKDLFFHNDRTAHSIRADYLMLLGMRSCEDNAVYTGYIDGRELLNHLEERHQEVLRAPHFITPFDAYSLDSNSSQILSEDHPILENHHSFRYYDTRTVVADGGPVEAKDALLALKDAIIKSTKFRMKLDKGDLFCFPNLNGLHNRDLVEINDHEKSKNRWLLKTYNFNDSTAMHRFSSEYEEGIPGLVKEIA